MDSMKTVYDLPENRGVMNAIKRARQMTGFSWTPVSQLPAVLSYNDMAGERQYQSWKMIPWFPQKGLIYSSVLKAQKFIGFNVSFEAFVTALSDPDSVLYRNNVDGQGRRNANCWYGVVCSCFVSYVLNMKERWICKEWPKVRDVTLLGHPELNELKLLDIVLNTKQHIAIITGIRRDGAGNVQAIEVSESALPVCRATWFTPEEFRGYWYGRGFDIYRKSDVAGITYTPSPFVRVEADAERGIEADPILPPYEINRDILPDQGNGTNYRRDQEIVLDLIRDGWDGAVIRAENGEEAFFAARERRVIVPKDSAFHRPGFYTARAVRRTDGAQSAPASFAVTGLTVTPADGSAASVSAEQPVRVAAGSRLTLRIENPSDDALGMAFIHAVSTGGERARIPQTAEDAKAGTLTLTFPQTAEDVFVFITAENRYGEYTSEPLYFKAENE